MDWIGKAPATAKIYADDPQYDVVLGGDRSWNAPAAGPTQILETDGTLRPANMADLDVYKRQQMKWPFIN